MAKDFAGRMVDGEAMTGLRNLHQISRMPLAFVGTVGGSPLYPSP